MKRRQAIRRLIERGLAAESADVPKSRRPAKVSSGGKK
jgi:hypothetical protein